MPPPVPTGLFMALLLLGAAIGVPWCIHTISNPHAPFALGLLQLAAPLVITVVGGLLIYERLERRRRRSLAVHLRGQGLVAFIETDAANAPPAMLAPFANVLTNAKRPIYTFVAGGQRNNRPILILEFQHVVGDGNRRHIETVSVAATPCPASWPVIAIRPRRKWLWRLLAPAADGVTIDDADVPFNAAYAVIASSETAARQLLTAARRRWLVGRHGPWRLFQSRSIRWMITQGWLTLSRDGSLRASGVDAFINLALGFESPPD